MIIWENDTALPITRGAFKGKKKEISVNIFLLQISSLSDLLL